MCPMCRSRHSPGIPEIKQTELPPETKTEEPLTPRVAQAPLLAISSPRRKNPPR